MVAHTPHHAPPADTHARQRVCPMRPHVSPPDPPHSAPHEHRGIHTAEHLAEHLREILPKDPQRLAIVCVGNELCGDDGAGVVVATELKGAVPWDVYDTQTVPESFLMKIVERRPECVLLVDALDFGAEPGATELFQAGDVGGQGPSTHGPAPLAFLDVLQMMLPCRRAVLGIQPAGAEFGTPLSPPVRAACRMVVQAFTSLAEEAAGP